MESLSSLKLHNFREKRCVFHQRFHAVLGRISLPQNEECELALKPFRNGCLMHRASSPMPDPVLLWHLASESMRWSFPIQHDLLAPLEELNEPEFTLLLESKKVNGLIILQENHASLES